MYKTLRVEIPVTELKNNEITINTEDIKELKKCAKIVGMPLKLYIGNILKRHLLNTNEGRLF